MFTTEQVKTAHSKVKFGADFPSYIQEMKSLGVTSYEHYVSNRLIQYYGADEFKITADAKWPAIEIAATVSTEK